VKWQFAAKAMAPAQWNGLLAACAQSTLFQTHGWGEFKRAAGWQVLRLHAGAADDAQAVAQVLLRRLPGGFRFAWIPGGPCFRQAITREDAAALLRDLCASLEATLGRLYLRCNFTFTADAALTAAAADSLRRPASHLGSGASVLLSLPDDDARWLATLKSKHRYYVRKACAAGLQWRYGNSDADIDAMAQLSAQMAADKAVQVGTFTRDELRRLRDLLPAQCRLLIGFENDVPLSGCAVFCMNGQAYYANAATVGRGRELSAAYAMLFELQKNLRSDGVRLLDFGGIAPNDPTARGVDHFKLGFGGAVVEYLGEWEYASTPLHRWLGNLAVTVRKRSL